MNCDEHFGYLENDDHCILVEYLEKKILTATRADIPETFNGKPVTVIGEKVFKDAVYLEQVTFPDSVTSIEWEAFNGCSSLREIVWANGLEYIGYGAFEWCTALERLELPEGVRNIAMYAFMECISLKEVVLPHSLDWLDEYAFENCSALEKIVFLNKDVLIGNFAFEGCAKLPAETLMYPMILSCNIEEPFSWHYNDYDFAFDWDTALREDVFALAMEHNSFENVDKEELFVKLLREDLMESYFPYMKRNDWIYREKQLKGLAEALCYYLGGKMIPESDNSVWFADIFPKLSDNLFNELAEAGDVELTAWLLEYKNRRFGFDPEDKYVL